MRHSQEVEAIRERARRVWGTGDYGPTSRQLRPASESLVEALAVTAGHRLLDVGAGDGNCVVAAARRGAVVCASDFSPHMIQAGRRRTATEGLDVDWFAADVVDLPFADSSFDRVTSVFGAIFAPDQEAAAAEMVRVIRPGGMVGFTAWTAEGFTARLLDIFRSYGPPPPPGAPDPLQWGGEAWVEEVFAALGCTTDVRRRAVTFRYPSRRACREAFEAHGMAVVARRTMPSDTYEDMVGRIERLTAEHDHGQGDAVVYDAGYLEVLVTKPGP